ncbi:MAG: spore germination protein [Candidatus Scatovivens sp.]
MGFKDIFLKTFSYTPSDDYSFYLEDNNMSIKKTDNAKKTNSKIFPSLDVNMEFIKEQYCLENNSDINIREFTLPIKSKDYKAFLLYIDGIINQDSINDFILQPLLLRNSINMNPSKTESKAIAQNISVKRVKKFNLEEFLINSLIPQNRIIVSKTFEKVIDKVNSGFCALFVDTLESALCIEVKEFKGRQVAEPKHESVIRGAHEAFVENYRTNTSLIRKIINNENLIIEESNVGKITKTKVGICYLKNIANNTLVEEVKNRINNLSIDFLLSSGALEQLIKDNLYSTYPQLIATERPDRVSNYLLDGRVAIIVDGSPFVLVVPAVFFDFITTQEDLNLNNHYSNFLRFIRLICLFFALLLPGLYVAITNFHQELLPSELLFAISSAREAIPAPILFEIIIMELSFELIREAQVRVPSPFGQTIGIIGALILGESAVNANIVSPILIIIVAFTGICSFAIPDFSLGFSIRIFRFFYIIAGYLAGFLGIGFVFFVHFVLLCNLNSFGVSYLAPYLPLRGSEEFPNYYLNPIWKREKRDTFLKTKKPFSEEKISMNWRENEKK